MRKSTIKTEMINMTQNLLKHSFVTRPIEDDINIPQKKLELGHSSTKANEIYTHVAEIYIKGIKNRLY